MPRRRHFGPNDALAQTKRPRQFPAGSSLRVVRRSGSEVTLNANVERHGVLVLVGPSLDRLWRTGREGGEAREVLAQMGPHRFGREREVRNRSPSGDPTNLGDVEV